MSPANVPTGPGTKGKNSRGAPPPDPTPGAAFQGSRTHHGTPSGHAKHLKEGTEPCDICRQAKAAYDYRRMSAPEEVQRNRINAKAQNLALKELKDEHYEEYRALYNARYDELLDEAGLKRRTRPHKKRRRQK